MIDPNLPLIDLHRHLDGNIRLETILEVGAEHNLDLPAGTLEGLRPHVQVSEPTPGVMAFIDKFKWMMAILVDYDVCQRVACENVIDANKEGLDYLELRFSPWFMAETHQLDPQGVVEAVVDGIKKGQAQTGQLVNLIGIISRTYGVENGWEELEALLTHADDLVAIDLAGDEANFPAYLFREHFLLAREHDLQVTAHAGEAAGADSIWSAIDDLSAVRIGHAVRAIDDPVLRATMRDNRIGIEANLTCNLQTRTVAEPSQHPIQQFLQEGLLVSINTDDPGISDIDLRHEYERAAPLCGLSPEETHRLQQNAFEIAFLKPEQREFLLKKFPRLSRS